MYGLGQQIQRQNANDPQVQIAQDAASRLNSGATPASLTDLQVDMTRSLAPFIIIYDKHGAVVTGTGYLNSKIPVVPFGVLQSSNAQPYHSITWQPASDVRIASVTVAAKDYYVLSGRSLKEVENRESQLMLIAGLGWVLSLGVVAATYGISRKAVPKK